MIVVRDLSFISNHRNNFSDKINSNSFARFSMTDDLPTQYALTGEQSKRKSTVKARISALRQLNIFVKTKKINAAEFTERDPESDDKLYRTVELENTFCSQNFWMQYGTFIVDFAKKKNKKALSPASAYNYMGIAKERIRLIYPNNRIWIDHQRYAGNYGWFSNIIDHVKGILTTRLQESGLSVEQDCLPIGILTQLILVFIQIYLSYIRIIIQIYLS